MKIFISYHNRDKDFALPFTKWITDNFENIEVFSTSVPLSIEPGNPWFNEIKKAAVSVDMMFLLISPDCIDYRWMLFEAGIASANEKHKIVPIIFGGVRTEEIKFPLSYYQILELPDKDKFNAFFSSSSFTPKIKDMDYYESFVSDNRTELHMKYGSFSILYPENIRNLSDVITETFERELTNIGAEMTENDTEKRNEHCIIKHPIKKEINGKSKDIVSVRMTLIPIRCKSDTTWKAGIAFDINDSPMGGTKHVLQLHSSDHGGLTSWSLYWKEEQVDPPINIPATLDFEKEHRLHIWFSKKKNSLLAFGIDSENNRCILSINGKERMWSPTLINANFIKIKGWIDSPDSQEFRVKVKYELDYC